MPLAVRISSTSPVETLLALTSQATPPSKSMPRLRPRNASDSTESTIIPSESRKKRRRRPTKSKVVSPWNRRCQRLGGFGAADLGGEHVGHDDAPTSTFFSTAPSPVVTPMTFVLPA